MAVEHGLAALARTIAATPRTPIPTLEWATVVAGTGEVHVVLDSDDAAAPRPVSDNAAGQVEVGQRVMVVHHGHRLTIISAPADVPDTGWTPLTLNEGFTGSAWVRVVAGRAELEGYVTRTGSNFSTSGFMTILTLPPQAWPMLPPDEGLRYLTATNNSGTAMVAFVRDDGDLAIRGAEGSTGTRYVALSTIPPWSV